MRIARHIVAYILAFSGGGLMEGNPWLGLGFIMIAIAIVAGPEFLAWLNKYIDYR